MWHTSCMLQNIKHRVTIPCKWSFDFMKSGRFHEIWWISCEIHPKPYKSKWFNQNYSVWWMQERGYEPGFHEILGWFTWNPQDFTWNPRDFKNMSFCVMIKYRSFFRKTKNNSFLNTVNMSAWGHIIAICSSRILECIFVLKWQKCWRLKHLHMYSSILAVMESFYTHKKTANKEYIWEFPKFFLVALPNLSKYG